MDIFLASIVQLYVLYILASHDKKSVFGIQMTCGGIVFYG